MLDYMKLSAIYWSLTALDLMKKLDVIDKHAIINFTKSCQNADGGIAPAPGHDSHLLSTLSAIQILVMYDKLTEINREGVIRYICSLQVCSFMSMGNVLSKPLFLRCFFVFYRILMVVSMEINGVRLIRGLASVPSLRSPSWVSFQKVFMIYLNLSKGLISKWR